MSYLYFGTDFFTRRHVRRELGENFREIDQTHLLDEAADSLRVDHVQWIDALNRQYGRTLDWWFGSISSRNIYSSRLFQYSCYLEVLSRLWQSPENRPALVFVESAALGKAIKKWGDRQGITLISVSGGWPQLEPLRNYCGSLAKWGYFALALWSRRLAARLSRKRQRPGSLPERPQVVVHTFVHDDSVNNAGDFQDRYLPYLHEFLAARGFLVLVYPVLCGFGLNYGSIYARLRQSSANFIIGEDYLKLADYLFALFYPLRRLVQPVEAPAFRGFDLNDLLRAEQRRNLADHAALSACLSYRLFKRLGQTGRINPRLIIAWYENQVTDKAVIAGSREAFPAVQVIGVQLFQQLSNDLNVYSCQSEVEAGLSPHLLLEMSEWHCRAAQAFTQDIPCRSAAALRYDHLFREPEGTGDLAPATRTVLVLLPFDLAQSVEMLETLKAGLDDLDPEVTILVKCHPDFQPEDLLAAFGKSDWPGRFRIFTGSLPAGLGAAAVVVSANSSAIVEAVVSGKPVLFICRQTALNQRVLAGLKIDLITQCHNSLDLNRALNKNLTLSEAEIRLNKEMGSRLRDLLFKPINNQTMSTFLGTLDQENIRHENP